MKKRLVFLAAAGLVVVNTAWAQEGVDPKVFDDLNGNMVADPDDAAPHGAGAPAQPSDTPDLVDLGETPPDPVPAVDPTGSTPAGEPPAEEL